MRVTTIRLALAVVGLGVFFTAMRGENSTMRWVGIGLVGVAWVLRFADPGVRRGRRGSDA